MLASGLVAQHSMCTDPSEHSCGGLQAQEGVGGKLHVFTSSLPKLGLHALTPRQASTTSDNQQKQTVLLPQHKGYREMAEDAAEHQVPPPTCLLLLSL